MFKKRLLKNYYTPGIISLIVLPILVYLFAKHYDLFKYQYVIEINYPNKKFFLYNNFLENNNDSLKLNIIFDGNVNNDKINYDIMNQFIIDSNNNNNNRTGLVVIKFLEQSTLQNYITMYDLCYDNEVNILPINNDEYHIFFRKMEIVSKVKLSPAYRCGTVEMRMFEEKIVKQFKAKEEEKQKFNKILKENFAIPAILYVLLVILSVRRVYLQFNVK